MKKLLTITTLCCSMFLTETNVYSMEEMKADDKKIPPRIRGIWYNEINSIMCITDADVTNNKISGTYESAVGAKGKFALTGQWDVSSPSNPKAIGFTVLWNNDESGDLQSVTSWSGQYDLEREEIDAFWLLTTAVGIEPEEEWKSTKVGQDVFSRVQPTNESVQKRLKKGNFSSPNIKK